MCLFRDKLWAFRPEGCISPSLTITAFRQSHWIFQQSEVRTTVCFVRGKIIVHITTSDSFGAAFRAAVTTVTAHQLSYSTELASS